MIVYFCHFNLLCNLQVISLESWVNIMYYIQDAHSFWDWMYFVALIVVSNLSFSKCSVELNFLSKLLLIKGCVTVEPLVKGHPGEFFFILCM